MFFFFSKSEKNLDNPESKKFNAYILKQYWYPYLVNSSTQTELLLTDSRVLNRRAKIRTLQGQSTLSIGAMNPTGTTGHWERVFISMKSIS